MMYEVRAEEWLGVGRQGPRQVHWIWQDMIWAVVSYFGQLWFLEGLLWN